MRCAALVLLAACGPQGDAGRIAIDTADAIWSGDGAFCARTGLGLTCWTSSPDGDVVAAPTIVAGLAHVTQLVLVAGEGCALHDGDVTCFQPGAAESRQRSFDQPTQLGEHAGEICAVHASGVSCWAAGHSPALQATPPPLRSSAGSATAATGRVSCSLDNAGRVTCATSARR